MSSLFCWSSISIEIQYEWEKMKYFSAPPIQYEQKKVETTKQQKVYSKTRFRNAMLNFKIDPENILKTHAANGNNE